MCRDNLAPARALLQCWHETPTDPKCEWPKVRKTDLGLEGGAAAERMLQRMQVESS